MQLYSIEVGTSYDSWSQTFVKASCPEEAAIKFLKSSYPTYNEPASIYEAAFNEHGVLKNIRELCKVELQYGKGYLFDHAQDVIRSICKLCGDWPGEGEKDFLDADGKCKICAALRIIKL